MHNIWLRIVRKENLNLGEVNLLQNNRVELTGSAVKREKCKNYTSKHWGWLPIED